MQKVLAPVHRVITVNTVRKRIIRIAESYKSKHFVLAVDQNNPSADGTAGIRGYEVIGNTPLVLAIFTVQTFVTHHSNKLHCSEALRRPPGNQTASVSKGNLLGAGEAVNNVRTLTEHLLLIGRLSYDVPTITLWISYEYRTKILWRTNDA